MSFFIIFELLFRTEPLKQTHKQTLLQHRVTWKINNDILLLNLISQIENTVTKVGKDYEITSGSSG